MVHKILSRKNPLQKRTGRLAQGEGPEFKPPVSQKKKEKNPVWILTHKFAYCKLNFRTGLDILFSTVSHSGIKLQYQDSEGCPVKECEGDF
jgi:hypothetical protein